MPHLYITRHGGTQWNNEGRFQGTGNSELTAKGLSQAVGWGQVLDLEGIDLILTSPLKRARETARLAKGERDIPLIILESLSEFDLGDWEGLKLSDLAKSEPANYFNYWNDPFEYRPSGGETYSELILRMDQAMKEIYELADGKKALVITHGMALMAILHVITGSDLKKIISKPVLRQTSITKVRATKVHDDITYEVELIGDTSHLDEETLSKLMLTKPSEE